MALGMLLKCPWITSFASITINSGSFACAGIPNSSWNLTLTPSSSSLSIFISVLLYDPPPPTITSSGFSGRCLMQLSAMVLAVYLVRVAIRSSFSTPSSKAFLRIFSANFAPNSSLPVVFGGFLFMYGCCISHSSSPSEVFPFAAISPSGS